MANVRATARVIRGSLYEYLDRILNFQHGASVGELRNRVLSVWSPKNKVHQAFSGIPGNAAMILRKK